MPGEADQEARLAVWQAICAAAEQLRPQCSVHRGTANDERMQFSSSVADVPTWQLVEALSLLSILLRAERVLEKQVCNLFRKTGPIRFREGGVTRYLWTQPTIAGEASLLGGRPDLVITSTADPPSAATTVRIVECKSAERLETGDIRAEFGKAHDLRVATYFIWSLNTPSPRLVAGALGLGLNLESLGFDTTRREEWVREPEALVAYVSERLEQARSEQRFARLLRVSASEVSRKMIRST